ncbi:MAG: demethoxyubiquinone hydroxylase family protein, partial [Pseudomonadota bacterium]|nr:demethoxyubiquinone hydroxylase family protein [Pseudomonadota bacterium]
ADEQTAILEELKEVFKKFRDEEQEHLETGLEKGAERAPFYKTLTGAVGAVSKAAIWAAERV